MLKESKGSMELNAKLDSLESTIERPSHREILLTIFIKNNLEVLDSMLESSAISSLLIQMETKLEINLSIKFQELAFLLNISVLWVKLFTRAVSKDLKQDTQSSTLEWCLKMEQLMLLILHLMLSLLLLNSH